jgi:hypothetical protein
VFPANPIGTFSAYGFVQNGAPVVVDVQAEPAPRPQLTIMVGERASSTTIDPGGEPLVIQYQGGGAAEPQVALFRLTSMRMSENGKPKPAAINIIGHRRRAAAMGSVAINRVRFGPPLLRGRVRPGRARLCDGIAVRPPGTDILRYRKGAKDTIVVERVCGGVYSQLDARAYAGEAWNGRADRSNAASSGVHLLQVTGWELTGDRAWVAAYSPTTVEVK